MVRHADSIMKKKAKAASIKEETMKAAQTMWLAEQVLENPRSLLKFCRDEGIKYGTFRDRLRGKKSIAEFNSQKQLLSPAYEAEILAHLLAMADQALPLTPDELCDLVNEILERLGKPERVNPQGNWYRRYLSRHRNHIQTHWSKPLDTQRAQAANPEVVHYWFHEVVGKKAVDRETGLPIAPELIFGMDESCCPPVSVGPTRVLGRKGTKRQHRIGSNCRENVTVIITICADGTTLVPTIIFKGQHLMSTWAQDNVSGARFGVSENGWTDNEHGYTWAVWFEETTREKADDGKRTRAIYMDGHGSHFTPEVLEYLREHNVQVLGYPPHCTHILQGLDVACFGRMKVIWKEKVHEWQKLNRREMGKPYYAKVFGDAYLKAFRPETVKAAFARTGIHPFNPAAIKPSQLLPSASTSTRVSFPAPQHPEVHAFMSVWESYQWKVTENDLDPTHYKSLLTGPAPPQSPTCRSSLHSRDEDLDPALFETPSKRMRMATGVLAASQSTCFLVDKTPFHSGLSPFSPTLHNVRTTTFTSNPFPGLSPSKQSRSQLEISVRALHQGVQERDRELQVAKSAQDGANAQLIIQNMFCQKQNLALNVKENPPAQDRVRVPSADGKGRCWTDAQVIAGLKAARAAKEADADAREQKRISRAHKKERKERAEKEWKALTDTYAQEMAEWKDECGHLKKNDPMRRDPPKRELKKSVFERHGLEYGRRKNVEEEGSSSSDEE